LFIHTGGSAVGGYRLILATNRDENYARPAAKAAPWKEDPTVIGGRDMEPGREGGTWLAACPTRRRVAALLNLPNETPQENARGRGSIVSNFVLGNDSTEKYLEEFHQNGHKYTPFNMITVDIKDTSSTVYQYSNFDDRTRIYENSGVLGFSNSSPEVPLKKVLAGKLKFQEIVNRCTSKDGSKEMLVDELKTLLQCKEQHLPDAELARRVHEAPNALAAIFVHLPGKSYGTRTHTIILVDAEGNFDFYEWTMVLGEENWAETRIHRTL